MKYSIIYFIILFMMPLSSVGQRIERVEPPNWWVGMQNPKLQLLIHGKDIAHNSEVQIDAKGVQIAEITTTENPNYLFLTLRIGEMAAPETFPIHFLQNGEEVAQYDYELRERIPHSAKRKSFSSEDVVYLLMPDRFANGNTKNDSIAEYPDFVDRKNPNARHGGDIQGIIDHLDYLQELGITALWSTPLLEDNQPKVSYHQYAITDYYKIDPRFGTNDDYARLSAEAQKRGIKLLMDVVPNHCGSAHWWIKDLPTSDWIHDFETYGFSNHRKTTTNDPYASEIDYQKNFNGWFDNTMPDLANENPLLNTYISQYIIWWIEFANLSGIRIDTYPYNDKKAMAKINKTILAEYPNMNIVGECWQINPAELAYWQKDAKNHDGFNSELPTVMDFSLYEAMLKAFTEEENWNTGLIQLYNSLAMDYLYANPQNIFTFCENHDTDHIMTVFDGDINKYKNLMTFLLTTRGIPQLYTGTEILIEGAKKDGDGVMRSDFPGGWKEDTRNAFTANGRTPKERTAFNFLKNLLQWRKGNTAIHNGTLKHYAPEHNTYVYFRSNLRKTVMVILNKNATKYALPMQRFSESIGNFTQGKSVLSNRVVNMTKDSILLYPNTPVVLELE